MYDAALMARVDYENVLAFAKQKAEKEGFQKGLKEAWQKRLREIALKMKEQNFSIDQISSITELPVAEIRDRSTVS